MPTTFPYGYAGNPQGMGTMLTWEQLAAKQTVSRLHPEFRRRVKALIHAAADAGVPLGIGTGWRVQPNPPPPGFAKPGNSNHEGFPVGPNSTGTVAADMVPNTGWQWMHDNAARFGLRTFRYVNNEPWHIQPAEIPASRRWRTEPWDLAEFPLPGDVVAPPPQPEFPLPDYLPTEDEMPLYFRHAGAVYAVKDSGGWRPVDGVELYKLARRSLESVPELNAAEVEALRVKNPAG